MGGGSSSKPGGKQTPLLVSTFESFYAEVTVNTSNIIINAKQHLAKIELVKYKNTFDKDLTHLEKVGESVPVLIDRLRTDVYPGDSVVIDLAKGMSDVLAFAGIYNGFEMHVMLYPGAEPPECVVIGAERNDNKQYNIRHDTPRDVASMAKAMTPEKIPSLLELFQQQTQEARELPKEERPSSRTSSRRSSRTSSRPGTPSEATPLGPLRPSSAGPLIGATAADPTSLAWLSKPARPRSHGGQSSPPISVDGDGATSVGELSSRSGDSGNSHKGVARRRRKKTAPSEPPHMKSKGKDIECEHSTGPVGGESPRSLDGGRRARSSSCGETRPRRHSWSGVTADSKLLSPIREHSSVQ